MVGCSLLGTPASSTTNTGRHMHDIAEILLKVALSTKNQKSMQTNKIDRHDIAEILLKMALNTITLTKP